MPDLALDQKKSHYLKKLKLTKSSSRNKEQKFKLSTESNPVTPPATFISYSRLTSDQQPPPIFSSKSSHKRKTTFNEPEPTEITPPHFPLNYTRPFHLMRQPHLIHQRKQKNGRSTERSASSTAHKKGDTLAILISSSSSWNRLLSLENLLMFCWSSQVTSVSDPPPSMNQSFEHRQHEIRVLKSTDFWRLSLPVA